MAHHIIITASSGIGQATTKLLLSKGHTVFTTARDESKISPHTFLETTNFEAVYKTFSRAGVLDGVVNCSGSWLLKSAHLTSKVQYQSVIDALLTSALTGNKTPENFPKPCIP